ncbi:GntR family transcriptional regulator [Streptomyces sp. AC495_CC817]|uniref:GntR family transcriptional regulator n=1 Tax=Streptomyces sp. AC495_CC817 TaxID=2823900 RepID=UPI001C25C465|nr:GntR family transcriptional regulator [Streptomyces sp. AC495_CC817]
MRTVASPLSEEAFHGIASRITNGIYEPGARISDKALAEEFGISRTPVREAMQRLERIGLVEMRPSRFTVVTEITPEMVRATWEFTGLYAGNILHLSLPRLSDAEREQAVALTAAAIDKISTPAGWLQGLIGLFGFLTERTDNELYRSLLGDSWYLILRNLVRTGISDERREAMLGALAVLSDAIAAADSEAAERAARGIFGAV